MKTCAIKESLGCALIQCALKLGRGKAVEMYQSVRFSSAIALYNKQVAVCQKKKTYYIWLCIDLFG